MNAGDDVHTLMREIKLPDHLDVGEGYGKTRWNVRAIWETYAGWFHHRSTTELYAGARRRRSPATWSPRPAPTRSLAAARSAPRRRPPGRGPPPHRPRPRGRRPTTPGARAVAADAHACAAGRRAMNFWETAWLRRSIDKLEAGR